jgi:hypothetical protein
MSKSLFELWLERTDPDEDGSALLQWMEGRPAVRRVVTEELKKLTTAKYKRWLKREIKAGR